jgi:hypothetical protein
MRRVRRIPSFKHRHFSSAHVAATHSRPDELGVKEWYRKGCRVQNSMAMCEVSQSNTRSPLSIAGCSCLTGELMESFQGREARSAVLMLHCHQYTTSAHVHTAAIAGTAICSAESSPSPQSRRGILSRPRRFSRTWQSRDTSMFIVDAQRPDSSHAQAHTAIAAQ